MNNQTHHSVSHQTTQKRSVVIIGAGLSGLYSAYLLKKHGIKATVLEARERIGGRIHSIRPQLGEANNHEDPGYFDMGPAWFWPEMNPLFKGLVNELGLVAFEQYSDGNYLIDESRDKAPRVYPAAYMNQSSSHRLEGGMMSIVNGLLEALPPDSVILNTQVTAITKTDSNGYLLKATQDGQQINIEADYVITAMPLRLLIQSIQFEPALPSTMQKKMQSLPTWMAAHAKIIAIYPTPFWRAQGHSGSAMSYLGPIAETHDASTNLKEGQLGRGALFGFMGVNAPGRKTAGEDTLKAMSIRQLTRIFGPLAAEPLSVELLDWTREPFTATYDDGANLTHSVYGLVPANGGAEHPHLLFAGSEAATRNGGYLEGALEAAETAIAHWQRLQG
jgi:monoamine oxidase